MDAESPEMTFAAARETGVVTGAAATTLTRRTIKAEAEEFDKSRSLRLAATSAGMLSTKAPTKDLFLTQT
jgi:hypothetical protein